MSTRASARIRKVSMRVNGGLAVNISGMSEDEGTIGWREFAISRDHDVMSKNGGDNENDDEDEDADEVDDEVDGEQSESSESSEDTVTVTRKRKYQGSHENYSKKVLLNLLNSAKDTITRLMKEGSQLKKELVQSRNDYKKVSITLKKEAAQHIKESKEHIRNLRSELQMEKDIKSLDLAASALALNFASFILTNSFLVSTLSYAHPRGDQRALRPCIVSFRIKLRISIEGQDCC